MFNYVSDRQKIQTMCDKAVSQYACMLTHCLDRYKTQKKCNEAVDDSLSALKSFLDWLVTSKTIKELHSVLFTADDIFFFDKVSGNATFSRDEISILGVYLNNIKIDVINFDKDDRETIVYFWVVTWHNRLKQHNAFKKHISKELIIVAWHPKRWWDWSMPEDEIKKLNHFLLMKSSIKLLLLFHP